MSKPSGLSRGTLLRCPVCSTDCVHLQSVQINRGGEITSVDQSGTKVKAGSPSGRGARVEIVLWCESGHDWRHCLQFHKGSVSFENQVAIEDCPRCREASISDLWRD